MKHSRIAVLLAAAVTGLAASSVRGRLAAVRSEMPDDVDVLYVPEPAYLRPMSLGYPEALADILWIRALVFAGASIGHTDVPAVGRYTRAITGLSPRFHRAYHWGSITAVYGGGSRVEREMVDTAIDIYRAGLTQFPESHTLLYGLGMTLTHQVGSTPGYTEAEREEYAAQGVAAIRRAAAFGADPLVRQYAATLVTEHATSALARQFLEAELAQAEDEDYRRMLRKKLQELGAGTSVQTVERVRDAFIEEHQREAEYVPDAVYSVIRDGAIQR